MLFPVSDIVTKSSSALTTRQLVKITLADTQGPSGSHRSGKDMSQTTSPVLVFSPGRTVRPCNFASAQRRSLNRADLSVMRDPCQVADNLVKGFPGYTGPP